MAEQIKSAFDILNAINVNEHTEKKNGLTYLSWAWAWAEVKKHFPDANYTIYENKDGWNYHTDRKTCWVKTGVTIDGNEHIEYLPVMDFKNRSIPFESVTSFDVNKAIQRSLTKAVARHGLGLYIYAGEDLPEGEETGSAQAQKAVAEKKVGKIGAEQIEVLSALFAQNGIDTDFVCAVYKIKSISDVTGNMYENILKHIEDIKARQNERK